VTKNEVDRRFRKVISEFSIQDSWIKTKKLKEAISDSVRTSFEIKIPAGLPSVVILNRLQKVFLKDSIYVKSNEITKGRITQLKIVFDKTILLAAELIPDQEIVRNTSDLAFILSDFEKLSESRKEEILKLPEKFAVILTPSQKSESLKKKVMESEKEYCILLNDNIDEVRFSLNPDYNDQRLIKSVKNILGSFGEAGIFLMDETTEIEKTSKASVVAKQFEVRKIRFVLYNHFITVKGNDRQDLQSRLRYYCESSGSSGNKIFLIDAEDYLEIKDVLETYRLKGYRFVPPSVLKYGLNI
ncbi:MAG: hypothetical protein ACM3Q2_12125, partial [Syntrophothermus sp.]